METMIVNLLYLHNLIFICVNIKHITQDFIPCAYADTMHALKLILSSCLHEWKRNNN